MTRPTEFSPRPGAAWAAALGTAAVLTLCAVYTWAALEAFPIWDDGWFWLLLQEKGPAAIVPSHPDRPVTVALWSALEASPGGFWLKAFAAQALGWPLLALVAALLWRRLFPRRPSFAVVAALVAVAPFVTKVQPVAGMVSLASLLPVLLVWTGVLFAFRFVAGARWPALGATAALVAVGVLLQEYGLTAAAAGGVLLALEAAMGRKDQKPGRAWIAAGVVVGAAALAYLGYLAAWEAGTRPEARPEYAVGLLKGLPGVPAAFGLALWRVTLGGLAAAAPRAFEHAGPVGWGLAASLAGLVAYALRLRRADTGPARPSPARTVLRVVSLVLAIAAGIVPVILMGRIPWDPGDGVTSRYGLPVLPVVGVLLAWALSVLPRRVGTVLACAIVALAGALAVADAREAVAERRSLGPLGRALQPRVAAVQGTTLVVVPGERRQLGPRRQWELTARLAAEWPEGLSRRFWALRHGGGPLLDYQEEARKVVGTRERCRRPGRLNREVRTLVRRGRVAALLWAAPGEAGEPLVEPYCRRP